ncbi:hypothetical protein [Candidatus Amarobacter glycogenicus]|uniref:hypothetical protein n=1 Tax=Candidatus Amarobacter glycogenicus TaxID=3140699 RepID=UPI002A13E25F|nr:hypothetical protein [Dehalococcoidia bacterium]
MDTVDQKPRIKASLISNRGCLPLSFCGIITFYAASPGKSWRGRSVLTWWMKWNNWRQGGVSHFEFQDDNFFVQPKRALKLPKRCARCGLHICLSHARRSDRQRREVFPAFRQAGLRYVGAGLESGSQGSLDRLNKETTVEENSRAWASCGQ